MLHACRITASFSLHLIYNTGIFPVLHLEAISNPRIFERELWPHVNASLTTAITSSMLNARRAPHHHEVVLLRSELVPQRLSISHILLCHMYPPGRSPSAAAIAGTKRSGQLRAGLMTATMLGHSRPTRNGLKRFWLVQDRQKVHV